MNNQVNLLQPISTQYLHIRSKDANQLQDGFNTDFSVQLQQAITCTQEQEIHISLSSLEIPASFYNISSNLENNTFVFNLGFADETITITDGFYDVDQLVNAFNTNSDFSDAFTMSYNDITGKITINNYISSNATIKWELSNINKELGWDENESNQTVNAGTSISSTYVVNLATVHSLYIKGNFSSTNVQSTRQGSSATIQKVSCDVNSQGIIYLNNSDHIQKTITSSNVIDLIKVKVTDQNDRVIQLNNCNYEMSMLFQIYPKYKRLGSNERRIERVITQPLQQPRTMRIQPEFTAREEPKEDIDDSHPIEGTSEIEHKAKRIILDRLLDQMSS